MVAQFEIKNLTLAYQHQTVVNDLSFEVGQGQILAFVGPNGAGKSSTMKVLAGLVQPDKGEVYIQEEKSNFVRLKSQTGYLIEGADFYEYLTGLENLNLLRKLATGGRSSLELLEIVGLSDARNKKVKAYSQGMKQRLGIAQALLGNPKTLILDEPFNGLDPHVKAEIKELLIRLKEEENIGMLISSHQLDDLYELSDHLLLIDQGRQHFYGSLEDLRHTRRNVTFWLHQSASEDILGQLPHTVQPEPGNKLTGMLNESEAGEITSQLTDHGLAPFKIEHANLFMEKYQEIA